MSEAWRWVAILAAWAAMWPLCRIIAWYETQDEEADK